MRLHGIQALRGIAALAVLLLHIGSWGAKYFPDAKLVSSIFGIFKMGSCGVDIFFVLSGFVMAYITPKPFRNWSEQGEFLWRRLTRIFPIYWLILAPSIAVRLEPIRKVSESLISYHVDEKSIV